MRDRWPTSRRDRRSARCPVPDAHVPVRTALWELLLVEHQRLVAFGAAELHTRVVCRQRFAVGRYDTSDVANDLAICACQLLAAAKIGLANTAASTISDRIFFTASP